MSEPEVLKGPGKSMVCDLCWETGGYMRIKSLNHRPPRHTMAPCAKYGVVTSRMSSLLYKWSLMKLLTNPGPPSKIKL